MTESRGAALLSIALAFLAVTAVTSVLWASLTSLRWDSPEVATLLAACRDIAVPAISPLLATLVALGTGAVAVIGLGARSASRQVTRTRRFTRRLEVLGPTPGCIGRTVLFADTLPRAFTAGLLRPRIYVSTGATSALNAEQLQAVFAHERHHARRRDPLRLLALRSLGDAFFFLPGVGRLAERYAALAEISADAAAVRMSGGRRGPLAAALLAFEGAPASGVVGVSRERVDSLLGERLPWRLPMRSLAWALVALGGVSLLAIATADAAQPASVPILLMRSCMPLMMLGLLSVAGMALLAPQRRSHGR